MANVALLWDKPSDAGAFSGGTWAAGLPLANLKTVDVQQVARTSNATTAATRFRVDLGASPIVPLSTFVLLNHNLTTAARWRIVVTSDASDADAGQRLLDTGLMPVWVPGVFGTLPWGAFPWDGLQADLYPGGPVALHIAAVVVAARYLWIYMEDAANPAGYVQCGRFLAGAAWSPRVNAAYGATIAWIDPGEPRRTRGGRRVVVARPRYRQIGLRFSTLSKDEAFGVAFEIGRQLGKEGDFLLVTDPAESGGYRFRRVIYAAQVDVSPIEEASVDGWAWSLTAEELI
jgi:hypothetical protein